MTLTSEEKTGCRVLANKSASSRLNQSDHFWSSSAILVSAELLCRFLGFRWQLFFEFLDFFSGGADEDDGDLTVSCWPTTPITDTVDGSTSSDDSLVGVADSALLASLFPFSIYMKG